jgi:hypothetical protein
VSAQPHPDSLKLLAFDAEDLGVLSAHMQDAVAQIGDMAFVARDRRFAMIANRFDWAAAEAAHEGADGALLRHRTALRFERVLAAQVTGIDLADKRRTLSILALQFTATTAPAGHITIICAGNAAIRLEVECLEAELKDLGAVWAAKARPSHDPTAPDGPKRE